MSPPDDLRRRRPLLTLAKIALTVGLLYLALRKIDFGALGRILGSVDWMLLALAATYTVVLHGLKPWRWLWLLRCLLPDTPYRVALRSSLLAAGARLVLPSKLGEFGRVLEVPGLKLLPGVGLTVLDLLMEVTAAFALAVPGALILGGPLAATIVLFLTALSATALLHPHRVLGPLTHLPGLHRLRDRVEGVQHVVSTLGRTTLYKGLALSTVLHAIRFGQLYVLFVALGTVPNAAAVIAFPLIQLADGFALTVGGVGVREWLSVQILPVCGIAPEAAVAAVFLQFALSNLLPALPGWWILYRGRERATAKLKAALAETWPGGRRSD